MLCKALEQSTNAEEFQGSATNHVRCFSPPKTRGKSLEFVAYGLFRDFVVFLLPFRLFLDLFRIISGYFVTISPHIAGLFRLYFGTISQVISPLPQPPPPPPPPHTPFPPLSVFEDPPHLSVAHFYLGYAKFTISVSFIC